MQYLSSILPLFSAVIFLCLGIAVYYLSRGALRSVFLRFCVLTFHWQFSWFLLFSLNSSQYSDLICKIGYSGIIFLPVSGYETVAYYLRLPKKHITWLYFFCFGFLVSLWSSDLFIKGAHLQPFGYYPEAGILHPVYVLMVSAIIILIISRLLNVMQKEQDTVKKNQLKFFLVSSIIFSLSAIDFVINYPFWVEKLSFTLYPFGVFFISFSMLLFVLSHFITLNLTLEKRVAAQTSQLQEHITALEEAARSKKDFIANVTHELRTPLTLIRGWTNFIVEGKLGKVPEKISDSINKIDLQTLNLTEKINELLKLSQFDAGMSKLVLTRLNLDIYISQIVLSFKGLTENSGIELSYCVDTDIKDIFVDKEKLKDILNNLIRNAYKFTEKGNIKVSLSKDNGNVVIAVKDTGIGMSDNVLKNIFDRFQQGDSSLTRKYEGTGLGLAIVKYSIEIMHGKISVDSIEKQGTTFEIKLPMDLDQREPDAVMERRVGDRRASSDDSDKNERRHKDRRLTDLAGIDNEDIIKISKSDKPLFDQSAVKTIQPEKSKGIIVIAEDNQGIQEFLSTALTGYTLLIAPNGQAAWQTIQEVMPDLVISDIMMPIMDGYALLEKIRTNKKTANLPTIIITALTELDDRIKSLQLGADDYLTKPFHHLELQARVKNVISLHKLERAKIRSEQLEIFLTVLASAIESKDPYTGGHVERVASYARDIARKARMTDSMVKDIYMGTIVHDVGKIGIKDEVLNKPGKLTDEEFEHIKTHSVIGKNLLSKLRIAPIAVNIAYYHQEKWNGSGYPRGLLGEKIPVEARIAAIADFWDAITSDRPYRKAMPLDRAVRVMHKEREEAFDPELLDLFMDEKDQLYLQYISEEKKLELYVEDDSKKN